MVLVRLRTAVARPVLLPLGLVLLPYLPLCLGRILYVRDLSLWIYPTRAVARPTWLGGMGLSWNPLVGLGQSPVANPLVGLAYPPNWLHLLGPLPLMVNVVLLLHLLFGVAGFFFLLRRMGLSVGAAVTGALAWGLGGFMTSMWTFGIFLVACSFAPWWAIACVDLLTAGTAAGARARAVVRLAAVGGLSFLAGELFVSVLCLGFGLCVASAWIVARGPPRVSVRPAAIPLLGVALAAALLLGCATILPALFAVGATARAAPLARAIAEQGSFNPLRLIEFLAGGMTNRAFAREPGAVMREIDGLQPLALDVYVGGSVLLLAALAFRRGARLPWILLTLIALSLAIGAGHHTPVHALFRQLVRPLAYMRLPEKYLALTFALLAILAALGAERWLRDVESGSASTLRSFLIASVLAIIGLSSIAWLPGVLGETVLPGAVHGGVGAFLLVGAQVVARRRPRLAVGLLVSVVAVDLGSETLTSLRWGTSEMMTRPAPVARALADDWRGQRKPFPPRLFRSGSVRDSVAALVDAGVWKPGITLQENLGTAFGIAQVPGYDAATSRDLLRLFANPRPELLRLLSVDYGLFPKANRGNSEECSSPLAVNLPGATLCRIEGALDRVFVAGTATPTADRDAGTAIYDPEVLRGERVLLPESQARRLGAPEAGRPGTCAIERYAGPEVEAKCRIDHEQAWVVFNEQYADGWLAFVDGRRSDLVRANLVMRAIPVVRGPHRIRLVFAPPGVGIGVTVSSVAAAGILLLWLIARRRDRRIGASAVSQPHVVAADSPLA